MKKRSLLQSTTLIPATLLLTTSVFAQNWYVDGGLGLIKFDDGVDTISPTNLYFRGGYQFNPNLNVGLESSATLSPDQISDFSDVDLSVTAVTFYVRGGFPISNSVWLYGQIGRANTEIIAEFSGAEVTADDNDTMLGLGADIDLGSNNMYLALNYSVYNNNEGVDVSGFNLGIGARF